MRKSMMLLLALAAAPLMAQGTQGQTAPPSAEKESFLVQPKNVAPGAKDLALRLVANTASGFTTSSSHPPEVKFSAGATLKTGSFNMLNVNEAECRVDIADDAAGTIDVSVLLYSVNGTKVLQTLRSTLGVTGTATVPNSQAKVGVESIELVRVNVTTPQKAGNIIISGKVAGTVSLSAPTGATFSKAPAVSTSAGTISGAQLASNNTQFAFTIENAAAADITARVADIQYSTALFAASGGAEGALACELAGTALGGQTALVVNAHTAKTTILGENDATSQPSASNSTPTETKTPDATTPPSNINTGTPDNRSLEERIRDNRNTNPNNNPNNNRGPGQNGNFPPPSNSQEGRGPARQPQQGQPQQPGQNLPPPPGPAPSSPGAIPVKTAGPGGSDASDGSASATPPDGAKNGDRAGGSSPSIESAPPVLQISPGLHFCDKEFQPLGALVLDKAIGGEAGSRVWIALKRAKDKDPESVESVTVKLTVGGVSRELILTETGKATGEFRCGKEGVLVIAPEDPDSNAESGPVEPPKARAYR